MALIRLLLWDDWNEEQIARHGATRREVDEAVFARPFVTRGRANMYRVIGQTAGGTRDVTVGLNLKCSPRFRIARENAQPTNPASPSSRWPRSSLKRFCRRAPRRARLTAASDALYFGS